MTPQRRKNFERLLNPRQIAFIGGKDASIAINEARRRGYQGQIWAVNPKRPQLAGVGCYQTPEELPEVPDAVFLAIPAAGVIAMVKRLNRLGVGGLVCYAAGFKEIGGDGVRAEAALRQAAGEMMLIGPNCYGLINYIDNVALWPFAHGGTAAKRGAAIVTQSGMISSDITMNQRSVPLSYMISTGNQAVVTTADLIELLTEKAGVQAIGLHLEGVQDIASFQQAALKALDRNIPIVALKTGSSAIGSALTISHTGALSGTNEFYQALFERTGVIRVNTLIEMLETLKYICLAGMPAGHRIAGFTCSGGGSTMLADYAATIGLDLPQFDRSSSSALAALLPDTAHVSNPLDYTTKIWGEAALTGPVFEAALATADVDAAIFLQDYPPAHLDDGKKSYQNDAQAFATAITARAIPAAICATLPENMDADSRAFLIAQGVAPMQGIEEALKAIHAAGRWRLAQARIASSRPAPLLSLPPIMAATSCHEGIGKAWLYGSEVAVPKGACGGAADVPDLAAEIGFPVALKMLSSALPHKTEAGAVMLNLTDRDAVIAAVAEIQTAVSRYDSSAVSTLFLVEAMAAPPLAELIVGIRRDAQFGLVLTLGSGGVLVELVGDSQTLLLPCTLGDLIAALSKLKVARLLNGFRGRPKADLACLAHSLLALTAFVQARADRFVEIEINPLFLYPDDVLAVDVLLQVSAEP